MATFVHVCADRDRARILRSGIRVFRSKLRRLNGVFATPVVEDYYRTHQWLRELKRYENIPRLVVRFRIPDDERVLVGRYNEEHLTVTAAEAVAIARAHTDPLGLEVIIPRAIRPAEIMKVIRPLKPVGWRYHPGAKGTKPCGCPYCQRGEPKSRKLRER